jgi:ATP-dependent DNA ligase
VVEKGESGHPEIHYEWGMIDGKQQLTIDIVAKGVNEGKANETTPLQQAHLTIERKAKKKSEEGYIETLDSVDEQIQSISFTERFLKELCFYKPKNSIDAKKIAKLEKAKRLMKSVKEDGMMYIVRVSKAFGVEIYSRRMELETDKFPHLVPAFTGLPNGTVLLGEMVLTGYDSHIKAFKDVTKICRSDAEKSLARQEEFGKVHYRIYDVAFANHENCLTSTAYKLRYEMAKDIASLCDSEYVKAIEMLKGTHAEAMQYVKDNRLEGLVLWDSEGIMEDGTAYTFNGKAYRPNMLWKSKPKYEDDFIVRFDPDNGIGEYGKGKNNGKVKSVFTYQLENGEEVFLGKCGGGLSDEQRDFYTTAEYPRVWRIEYDAIQPETGALRYPVFNADRTLIGDKFIEECLMSDAIKLAREEENEDG